MPPSAEARGGPGAAATGYGLYNTMNKNQERRKQEEKPIVGISVSKKRKVSRRSTSKRVKVKLLKYVNGIGLAGDILTVTPAFFQEKLRPSRSAQIISSSQGVKESRSQTSGKAELDNISLKRESIEVIDIVIKRKANSGGRLFRGVGERKIMNELSKQLPSMLSDMNGISLLAVSNENGTQHEGDITRVGKFVADINLPTNVVGKVNILVEALL